MISAGKTKSHSKGWLFFVVGLCFTLLYACGEQGISVSLTGYTMGTTWHITYLPDSSSPSQEQLQAEIEAILAQIDASMSTYRADSEISLVSTASVGEWTSVSKDFLQVLDAALSIGSQSRGAYDVTVGPLVDRWGFGPVENTAGIPSSEEIQQLRDRVGQDKLQIDRDVPALMKSAAIALDFSSIAKGFAVDRLAEHLLEKQIANFLVEVGGEMRLAGLSGRGDPWRIAIEQPDIVGRNVAQALALTDSAVATSGDYRNFFEMDGKRYSHSIDPRTGFPVAHDLVSVTVIHDSAMLADGWATALTVLGVMDAMEVALEQDLAVYFIRRHEDGFTTSSSEAFEPYLQQSIAAE